MEPSTINQTSKPIMEIRDSVKRRIRSRKMIKWGIAFFILLFLTLPFHYVPSQYRIFTKDNLTFSNTFIFQSDIDEMIKRYNYASLFEKISIANEPLYKKLKGKGIIYIKNETPLQKETPYNNSENSDDNYHYPGGNTSGTSNTIESTQQEEYSAEDKKNIDKIKAKTKRDWPNDYSVQKLMFDQQVEAYFYMKTVTDLKIKRKVQAEWPLDYTVQKMMYNQEIDAKEQMK